MAKQLQLRGGTTSEHSTFTGAVREVTVDTDKDTLVVHDGSTAGGHPLAKEDHNHDTEYQPIGTYNPTTGTDTDLSTPGSTVLNSITFTDGVAVSHSTRTMTLADLGYTGETNATADQTATEILTAIKTVDGSGSGLDADLLDGQNGSYYLAATEYTASDVLTKIKTVDGSGSGLDADTVDGIQASSFGRVDAVANFASSQNTAYAGQAGNLTAYGSTGATMSFHRPGYYAVNMGLDSDNVFRIGGWSASSNRLQMDMSGNLTMAGNVTAYSDERLKSDIKTIDGALDKVMSLRGCSYIKDDKQEIGVIAQEVEKVIPEVVMTANDDIGTKSVAYGNMVGLLIEAIKELKTEIDQLKAK